MRETLFLIGEIFIIICMQTVFDFFVDDKRNPYLATALKTACYVGAFYLVLSSCSTIS